MNGRLLSICLLILTPVVSSGALADDGLTVQSTVSIQHNLENIEDSGSTNKHYQTISYLANNIADRTRLNLYPESLTNSSSDQIIRDAYFSPSFSGSVKRPAAVINLVIKW